jgi:hypothetical protein
MAASTSEYQILGIDGFPITRFVGELSPRTSIIMTV